jgi:hypothetical protein
MTDHQEKVFAMTQHSGTWGPWYHISVYRREPSCKTGYVFVCRYGGHYSRRAAKKSGYGLGRPDRRRPEWAY